MSVELIQGHFTFSQSYKLTYVKENILWGPSPRAGISLLAASKAKALLEERYSPSKLDVKSLIRPILSHRINLNISAKADNINLDDILDDVAERIEE